MLETLKINIMFFRTCLVEGGGKKEKRFFLKKYIT